MTKITSEMEGTMVLLMARIEAARPDLDTALGQLISAYLRDTISGVREGRDGYDIKVLEKARRVSDDCEDLLKRASPTH
jgi:hypothetical protein